MKPAYLISLSAPEKRLIAEVAATQSQIEWLMRLVVQNLLVISPKLAQTVMGSTSIRSNSVIWIATVREKCSDADILAWAEYAYSQLPDVAGYRNNLVHTLFGLTSDDTQSDEIGPIAFLYAHRARGSYLDEPRHGVRVKDSKHVDLKNISEYRNALSELSVIFAHIESFTNPGRTGPSPWLGRLRSKRPPRPARPQARKGRKREAPPEA